MRQHANKDEVITLMREGWELGRSMSFDGSAWLQKGGWGKGGETRDVWSNTMQSLYRSGLIELESEKYPTARYRLTDFGRGGLT